MVKVKDLPNFVGSNVYPKPFLHCSECFAEYSANRHDYFLHPDEHAFTCCGEPMRLMTKRIIMEEWGVEKQAK